MSDLRTSIILGLSGNLQNKARQYIGSLNRMGRQGSASMRLLGRGVSAAGRGLDRLGNRYTALITGAAGVGAIRAVGDLEERFTRLGIFASRSDEEMAGLKKRIYEVAKAPEIRVDPGRITSAVEEIIEKTGDLKFAQENIRNIGLTLSATGAQGQAVGGIAAEFQKMKMTADEAFESMDILTVQGKEGAFTFQDLAQYGSRVVTAYTAMGRTGVPAIRELGAALQVIRQGTGESAQTATTFEALMRVLGDAKKAKLLQKGGVKVFDPKELEKGRKVLRPINLLMAEIVERVKGDRPILQQLLGDQEAIRGFNTLITEYNMTGAVQSLDRFYGVQADGSTITRDSIRAAKTFNAALTNLLTVWKQFSDDQLAEPVKKLTEYLDGLKPGTVERWLELGKNLALIGGGAVGAYKLFGAGMKVRNLGKELFGSKKGGAKGGLGRGKFGDAVPVYVVNGPASIWDGPDSRSPGDSSSSNSKKRARAAGGTLAVMGALGAIGTTVGTFSAATDLARNQVDRRLSDYDLTTLAKTMNKWANLGATHMYEYRQAEEHLRSAQMRGELEIKIDQRGFISVEKLRGENLDMDVDSGRMMVAP